MNTLDNLIVGAEDAVRAAEMHLAWLLERKERARIAALEASARPDPDHSDDYQYIGDDH